MKRPSIRWIGAIALAMTMQAGGHAQRGGFPPPFGGPGGPGMGPEEIKLVKQFDKDGDKILNAAERKAAREYLASSGAGNRRGRGFGGRGPGMAAPVEKGRALSPKDVQSFPTAGLFDPAAFRTFFLTFEDADWEDQLMVFKNTDVDVPATLAVDGKTYRDVGVHFHGSSSFMMVPAGLKHSIKIELDPVHAEQQIGGQHTLLLLNSHEDATYLRSLLYYEIARDYLPAPKANYGRIVINGESWGAYVNAQHFSKDFIRDWFNTTDGARWKVPGSPRARGGLEYLGKEIEPYKQHYEIKSKNDPKSWADLANLARVLNETPADRVEAALAPILDVDEALRFLAVDNALVNDDGYWTRASDYSIYEDVKGRFHVFPWDANETFAGDEIGGSGRRGFGGGGFGRGPAGSATLDPLIGLNDSTKPLRSKLLAVPALRAKYLGYVKAIATKWLDWKTLGPLASKHQAVISAEVKIDAKKLDTYEAFQSGVTALKTFAAERRAYLLEYVDRTSTR